MPKNNSPRTRARGTVREADLGRWKLLAEFQERLSEASGKAGGTWADPRRQLSQLDYLSLLLFGLFNPVVESMRGLCAASALGRVQREVCRGPVSLGSFSEAQGLVDPSGWKRFSTIWRRKSPRLRVAVGAMCAWRRIAKA